MAYQFHCGAFKAGLVLIFNRPRCRKVLKRVRFHGQNDDAMYQLIYEGSGTVSVKSGKELSDGIDVKILQRSEVLPVTYRERGD